MNTSKPNPHTITPTTVMESDFDEPTPHRKPGKSTGRPRSRHKHIYTEAWYVHCYTNQITGKTTSLYYPLRYCTVCGRIGGMQVAPLSGQNRLIPPIGSKVFSEPPFGSGAVDLNNFTIFKGE